MINFILVLILSLPIMHLLSAQQQPKTTSKIFTRVPRKSKPLATPKATQHQEKTTEQKPVNETPEDDKKDKMSTTIAGGGGLGGGMGGPTELKSTERQKSTFVIKPITKKELQAAGVTTRPSVTPPPSQVPASTPESTTPLSPHESLIDELSTIPYMPDVSINREHEISSEAYIYRDITPKEEADYFFEREARPGGTSNESSSYLVPSELMTIPAPPIIPTP